MKVVQTKIELKKPIQRFKVSEQLTYLWLHRMNQLIKQMKLMEGGVKLQKDLL